MAGENKIVLGEAVRIAAAAFADLYPIFAANNLSRYDDKRTLSPHDKRFKPEMCRAYKTFKIDSSTGRTVSMKIRTVD